MALMLVAIKSEIADMAIPIRGRHRGQTRHRHRIGRRSAESWTLIAINLVGEGQAALPLRSRRSRCTNSLPKGIILSSIFLALALTLWFFAFKLHRIAYLVAAAFDVALLKRCGHCTADGRGHDDRVRSRLCGCRSMPHRSSRRRYLFVILGLIGLGCCLCLSGGQPSALAGDLGLSARNDVDCRIDPPSHSVSRLRYEADTDALTGLLNRRGFFRQAALARSVSGASLPLALVVIDLDDFKSVNDSHGPRRRGDRMLVEATRAWRSTIFPVLTFSVGSEATNSSCCSPTPQWKQQRRLLKRCRVAYPARVECRSRCTRHQEKASTAACVARMSSSTSGS